VQEGVVVAGITTLTLSEVPIGTRVRVRELSARPEISRRLRELGIHEHAIVSCVSRGHGNLICAIHSTRIGIDRRLAAAIHVAPSE
jgi:Fe2+ transport system protein FeoA